MKRNYLFTSASGELDMMTFKEAEAIERSGRCSVWEYIATPTVWPKAQVPALPLMDARPGKTEPVNETMLPARDEPKQVVPPRHAVNWTYEELCDLMKLYPFKRHDARKFGEQVQRNELAVLRQMTRLKSLILDLRLRWDGERILRGKCARVHEWPVGWRNPKR